MEMGVMESSKNASSLLVSLPLVSVLAHHKKAFGASDYLLLSSIC
jgi:hypothetical protein